MSFTHEKSLEKILKQPNSFAALVEKVKYLNRLNLIFAKQFPNLASHCQIANLRNDKLIVEVNNNAWATRIHYQSAEIINQLKQFPEFCNLQQLNYFVKKNIAAHAKNKKPLTISTENKTLVREIADCINQPALKKALLRIGTKT